MRFLIGHKWIIILIAIVAAAIVFSVVAALVPGVAVGSADWLGGVLKPVQVSLASVSDWASSFWTNGRLVDELLTENALLRKYVADIDEQARLYDQMLKENDRLRDLLEFKRRSREFTFTSATVIARDTDNYAKTFTLSRGSKHGVKPQMLAVNEIGQLLGVVSETGSDWATLRTLVDSDFACGAYVYRARIDGVCQGNFKLMNDGRLTMTGFTPDVDIKVGDEVLTSGVGGLFPRDVVIGTVSELLFDLNGMTATAVIQPAADLRHIEQVFLVTSFESEE